MSFRPSLKEVSDPRINIGISGRSTASYGSRQIQPVHTYVSTVGGSSIPNKQHLTTTTADHGDQTYVMRCRILFPVA